MVKRTSDQLMEVLNKHNDVDSAIQVYKDALAEEKNLKDVKKMALFVAESDMKESGEFEHRAKFGGTAGYTKPKASSLNKEAWQEAVKENPSLKGFDQKVEELEYQLKMARTDREQVQRDMGFYVLNDPKFYIKG